MTNKNFKIKKFFENNNEESCRELTWEEFDDHLYKVRANGSNTYLEKNFISKYDIEEKLEEIYNAFVLNKEAKIEPNYYYKNMYNIQNSYSYSQKPLVIIDKIEILPLEDHYYAVLILILDKDEPDPIYFLCDSNFDDLAETVIKSIKLYYQL